MSEKIFATYFNVMKLNEKTGKIVQESLQEVANDFVNFVNDILINKANCDTKKNVKNLEKISDNLIKFVADETTDAYVVGFGEGRHAAEKQLISSMLDFIKDGSINDLNDCVKFLKLASETSDEVFAEGMKGRDLIISEDE